ncbi:O-antigen ligase [Desulfocicer vacuolatum DSM 3385]|uniref:O-antigen ligase n=1 Tax=Desulfocicer vacuolatum DSM 3385 TaxID=1121400 RepID=A0A1W1ZP96_9BACT|nr:O-antigen ligase family protein [Desulfocicer vacuolatum]SMC50216.1 O-antigen ligase [Desulfocicer vacuolatum DSM 3385]
MRYYLKQINFSFLLILTYVAYEYWRLSAQYPVLSRLHIGKLLGIVCIIVSLSGTNNIRYRCGRKLLIWLFVCMLSIPFAISPGVAWDVFITLLLTGTIYLFLSRTIDTEGKLVVFISFFVMVHLKLALWQIRTYLTLMRGDFAAYHIREGVGGGSTGFLGNAGDFGVALTIVVPLTLLLIGFFKSTWIRMGALMIAAGFVLSVICTGSRASALALLLAFASILFFIGRLRKILAALLAIAVCVFIFWSIAPEQYKMRFESAKNYEQDSTANQRLMLWEGGFAMFLDHPFLGVGLGNFPVAWVGQYAPNSYSQYEDETGKYRAAIVSHNNFVCALAETGMMGLSYFFLVFTIFRVNLETINYSRNLATPDKKMVAAGLMMIVCVVAFVVSGCLITTIYYPHVFLLAALSDAIANIRVQKSNSEKNREMLEV